MSSHKVLNIYGLFEGTSKHHHLKCSPSGFFLDETRQIRKANSYICPYCTSVREILNYLPLPPLSTFTVHTRLAVDNRTENNGPFETLCGEQFLYPELLYAFSSK